VLPGYRLGAVSRKEVVDVYLDTLSVVFCAPLPVAHTLSTMSGG
jgi:hypothetical protein